MSQSKLQTLIDNLNKKPAQNEKIAWIQPTMAGDSTYRILPNKKDSDEDPGFRVFLHEGFVHPNYGNKSTFRCLGKGCPMCAFAKARKSEGDQEAWRYTAKLKYLFYVQTEDGRLGILKVTNKAYEAIIQAIVQHAQNGVNVLDLRQGRNIVLSMNKQEKKTEWSAHIDDEKGAVAIKDTVLAAYKAAKKLDEAYREYSKDELKSVLAGEKLENKSQQAPASKKAAKAEDSVSDGEVEDDTPPEPKARQVVHTNDDEDGDDDVAPGEDNPLDRLNRLVSGDKKE